MISIHHLVVDGLSWRILLADLGLAYARITAGEPVSFPPKTTSFQSWSRHVERYAHSDELLAELGRWSAPRSVPATPRDVPVGGGAGDRMGRVSVSLPVVQTEALLAGPPRVFGSEINDVLLSAFALAMRDWSGSGSVLIDLEGHGREYLFAGIDLSRTVGWFTSIFPVEICLGDLTDPPTVIREVKNQLRSLPKRGVGYGILRYLGEPAAAQALRSRPDPQICFNYLGQFGSQIPGLGRYAEASWPRDQVAGQHDARPWLLIAECIVIDQVFSAEFTYAKDAYREEAIASLASCFIAQIRALVAFTEKFSADSSLSITDVSLSKVSAKDMENILKGFNQ